MNVTKDQIIEAVRAVAAVGEAIRELGQVPLGLLYTKLMPVMDLPALKKVIATLEGAELVELGADNVVRWIGPVTPADPEPTHKEQVAQATEARARYGLYNNDPDLFANARRSYAERGIALQVIDGMVHAGEDGWVARFKSDDDARACLMEAGYQQHEGKWTPRAPSAMAGLNNANPYPNGRWS